MTLLFIILRAANFYGDPRPWSTQQNALYTFLSFINCEKYPPSLLFLLMTLGPAIIALALFERFNERPAPLLHPLVVFGRVPLFYYVLHLPLIHGWRLVAIIKYARQFPKPSNRPAADYGYGLPVIHGLDRVVLALYPAAVVRRRQTATTGCVVELSLIPSGIETETTRIGCASS